MDLERLHREVGDAVADRLRSLSLDGSSNSELDMDQVARQLHQTLLGRNENTKQLHVENIYRESEGECSVKDPITTFEIQKTNQTLLFALFFLL